MPFGTSSQSGTRSRSGSGRAQSGICPTAHPAQGRRELYVAAPRRWLTLCAAEVEHPFLVDALSEIDQAKLRWLVGLLDNAESVDSLPHEAQLWIRSMIDTVLVSPVADRRTDQEYLYAIGGDAPDPDGYADLVACVARLVAVDVWMRMAPWPSLRRPVKAQNLAQRSSRFTHVPLVRQRCNAY